MSNLINALLHSSTTKAKWYILSPQAEEHGIVLSLKRQLTWNLIFKQKSCLLIYLHASLANVETF